ncbi:MFS transporter [Microvirga lotononidis]|uniref:Arabinose efflux permease family protein n=1 Tax=Microvirga lotononidis TaxID=864069 RepID=I4YMV1_9HYPH|nr:MFS transporter [Microvirga lotononidis]EIM25293.1 arabinose efflux permease family protein [Microvirga lotononidis]WQO29230.1 MFS transporter [Microvirga lotononidis]
MKATVIRLPETGLWQNPDFLRLWGAQTLSAIGSRFTREGLPIIAALTLDASAKDLGLLVAFSLLPGVLLSPFIGAWIDRTRRRRVLIVADLLRAAALATLPAMAWFGSITIGQVMGVSAAVAFLSMFFQTADNAYLPTLVNRDQLLEGNAKLATTDSLAEIAGPALAGTAIQLVTAPVAILFDVLSYVWSALLLASIKRREPPLVTGEHAPDLWRETGEGLRFVFGHPVLRPLTLCSASLAFFMSFFAPLYVLFAVRDLSIQPGILGLVVALGGISALIGAQFAAWAGRRFRLRTLLIGTLLIYGLMICFIPLAQGPLWMAVASLCIAQLLSDGLYVVFATNATVLRQKVTPDSLRGREAGTLHLLTGGLGLVAALGAGFAADWIGIRAVLWAGALGVVASTLWLLALPQDLEP